MIPRSLALGLLAAGCVAAAGGGAYVAVRQNATPPAVAAPAVAVETAPATGAQPVAETEAIVTAQPAQPIEAPAVENPPAPAPRRRRAEAPPAAARREGTLNGRAPRAETRTTAPAQPTPSVEPRTTASAEVGESRPTPPPAAVAVEAAPELPRSAEPPPPAEPQFEQVTVPAAAVIGLQIETAVTSERAQVEDRVAARVTRDVMSQGRVAIPAGSRVLGSVTLVDKGGKVKERARLGVRFHTLVLADGSELPLRTEAILREGESPAGDSSRKIGGAAVGGAILGAILGGGKGAVIGGATGAAGGTAAVMAGDRHAATLPSGTILTVRVSSPVDIQVEKR
jgi:hypothetical protein